MGNRVSRTRVLPRTVSGNSGALVYTGKDTGQVDRLKTALSKIQQVQHEQQSLIDDEYLTNSKYSASDHKTVSDYISKNLAGLRVEKEVLNLDPNHSSLKRLSKKKTLEEEYKQIMNNLDNTGPQILSTDTFHSILSSLPTTSHQELQTKFNLSKETLLKVVQFAQIVSVPTERVQIVQQSSRSDQLLEDEIVSPSESISNDRKMSDTHENPENELNQVFSDIIQSSQTGYDIHELGSKNRRKAHRKQELEVKRVF